MEHAYQPRRTVVNLTARDDALAISSDGLTLYFATKRSSGTLDLWQAARSSPMSDWDTPTSLGRTVNSSSDDHGVSISQDGLTLYFASGRAGSSGGDDLWQTTLATLATPWSTPTNLGPAVNSASDDAGPKHFA